MMKRWITFGMAATMAISLLAGCGGNNQSADSAAGSNEQAVSDNVAEREHVDVTMLLISPNCNETELNKIAEKASEITEAKFNTTLHLITVTPADYTNKMNMMLASGDTLDIFQGFSMYGQYVSQGYMMAIEDYADYYQDALEVVGDRIAVSQQDGHTYGIPFMNLGGTGGDAFGFRKDIIDSLGINLDEVVSWEDFADVLRQIKEAYPDMTPLMGGSTEPAIYVTADMATGYYADTLGDSSLVGVLDPANNSTVTATVKNEGFKTACDYAWEWAQEGLIGYDEVSQPTDLVKSGRSAVMHTMNGPVVKSELESGTGYEMEVWVPDTQNPVVFTNNAWTWCITDYCENPERALEVLNEFYINADLANLLEWGIEGEHYQVVDEENGVVDFLEGENMGNVKYYNYIKDNIPNCYLCYVGTNEDPDKWQLYEEFKENNTQTSPYLGFTFDQSPVQNQVAACTNVMDKYFIGLLSGQLDPSTEYDKMIAEMETAGIDDIVAEAQSQLDEWIAENQ